MPAHTLWDGKQDRYEDLVAAWQQRAGRKIEKPVTQAWVMTLLNIKIGPSDVNQNRNTNMDQIIP